MRVKVVEHVAVPWHLPLLPPGHTHINDIYNTQQEDHGLTFTADDVLNNGNEEELTCNGVYIQEWLQVENLLCEEVGFACMQSMLAVHIGSATHAKSGL